MTLNEFPFVPDKVQIRQHSDYNSQIQIDEEGVEIRRNATPESGTIVDIVLTGDSNDLRKYVAFYLDKKGSKEGFVLGNNFWRNINDINLLNEVKEFTQNTWILTKEYSIIPINQNLYEIRFSIQSIIEENKIFNQPIFGLKQIETSINTKEFQVETIEVPVINISNISLNINTGVFGREIEPYILDILLYLETPEFQINEKFFFDLFTSPEISYSVTRRTNNNYLGGLIKVKRSENSSIVDIYTDYKNEISLDSPISLTFGLVTEANNLGEFIGNPNYDNPDGLSNPNDAELLTIYDQSGSGQNLTPTDETLRPEIVSSGELIRSNNGKPCAKSFARDEKLTSDINLDTSSNKIDIFFIGSITEENTNGNDSIFLSLKDSGNNNQIKLIHHKDTNEPQGYFIRKDNNDNSSSLNSKLSLDQTYLLTFSDQGDNVDYYRNGNLSESSSINGTYTANFTNLEILTGVMEFQEAHIYPSNVPDKENIEDFIAIYFSL